MLHGFGHKYKVYAFNFYHQCDFWHCIFSWDYFGELTKLCWNNPLGCWEISMLCSMLVGGGFWPGVWLAGDTAASLSDPLLEDPCWLSLPRVRGFWYLSVGVCNGNFRFTRVSELLIVILWILIWILLSNPAPLVSFKAYSEISLLWIKTTHAVSYFAVWLSWLHRLVRGRRGPKAHNYNFVSLALTNWPPLIWCCVVLLWH